MQHFAIVCLRLSPTPIASILIFLLHDYTK